MKRTWGLHIAYKIKTLSVAKKNGDGFDHEGQSKEGGKHEEV